jgi:hypothetical protein
MKRKGVGRSFVPEQSNFTNDSLAICDIVERILNFLDGDFPTSDLFGHAGYHYERKESRCNKQ